VEVETQVQPEVEIAVEPVAEEKPEVAEVKAPEVKPAPAPVAQVNAGVHHATAPMTRAPAPEYVPEAPRHSDWVRPAFDFEGKGSAGGHSATHQATAPATRPQPAE
jgi:ribonuclease E